jgi:TolB-like protein/DNA-binding winged helix-turn-helix (wHTH) protein/cytochrome c-type biogenesis protein CcmH/NrfG
MDQERNRRTVFKAGDLVLEPDTRRIRIAGSVVDVPRLSYRLLEVLISEAPSVVSADELIEKVWQNRVVSPETITQRVKLARQAIGDDAKEPKYIGVVWGQGYRFLTNVEQIPAYESSSSTNLLTELGWRRIPQAALLYAALAVLLMVAATMGLFYLIYPDARDQPVARPYTQAEYRPDAVAVLPFRLVGDNPDDQYISEGIAYELRAQLGRVKGLEIAAETSSTAFRDQNVLAQEISSRLGVGRLIEASVAPQGDSVRVSVRIIDGMTGLQTWSQTYEGAVQRLVEIQQQVALDVVRQLVDAADPGLVIGNPITQNAAAYDLMLRARHLEQQVRDEQIVDPAKQRQVIELYRQATEADPNSAIAYSRLASALLYIGDVGSAQAPIIRAMTLDPAISDVQYTLGHYYWLTNDERAGEAYREAIRLNGESADALGAYAHWLLQQADADKAGEYFRRALNLDPQSLERYRDLGGYYGATGKRQEALLLAQDIQLRFDDVRSYQVLARIYEQTGDVDVAIAWVRKAVRREPGNSEFKWQLAELYSRIGESDMANFFQPEPGLAKLFWQRRYDELIDAAEEAMIDYPRELPIRYMLAFAYNVHGRYADAISLLERSGLPHRATSSSRFVAAVEALVTLTIAYQAVGRTEEANDALQFIFDYVEKTIESGVDKQYWPYLYGACALSIADRNEEALAYIRSIVESSELVWEPVLRDAPCFAPFANHPDYLAVLEDFEQRRRALRDRLPRTLERFSESEGAR